VWVVAQHARSHPRERTQLHRHDFGELSQLGTVRPTAEHDRQRLRPAVFYPRFTLLRRGRRSARQSRDAERSPPARMSRPARTARTRTRDVGSFMSDGGLGRRALVPRSLTPVSRATTRFSRRSSCGPDCRCSVTQRMPAPTRSTRGSSRRLGRASFGSRRTAPTRYQSGCCRR